MRGLAELLTSFDMDILFKITHAIATVVATYLAPVLLLISIYIRLMETQISALVDGGGYGRALKDIILWSFVLGSYFAIGNLISDFFNAIYAWLETFGSIKVTMESYARIMEKNKIAVNGEGVSVISLVSSPYVVFAELFYYGTLIIMSAMSAFLKIANILILGLGFIWGLIAIPISISTTFRILRGWAFIMAFALVWPIVQSILMAMFGMLFANAADTTQSFKEVSPMLNSANIMMLFAVMNILLCCVLVCAPLIANSLVTNSSSAAGVVMPFVGAAAAAGAAMGKQFRSPPKPAPGGDKGGHGGGAGPSQSGSAGPSQPTARHPVPNASTGAGSGASDIPSAGGAAQPPGPVSTTPQSGATPPPAPNDASDAKRRQTRRGVVINALKRGGGNKGV